MVPNRATYHNWFLALMILKATNFLVLVKQLLTTEFHIFLTSKKYIMRKLALTIRWETLLVINFLLTIWLKKKLTNSFSLSSFQLLRLYFYPFLSFYKLLVSWIRFFSGFWKSKLIFCELSCCKVFFIWDLKSLFSDTLIYALLVEKGLLIPPNAFTNTRFSNLNYFGQAFLTSIPLH